LDELADWYPNPWINFDFSSRLGKPGARGFASNMNEIAIRGGRLCQVITYKILPPATKEEFEKGDPEYISKDGRITEIIATVIRYLVRCQWRIISNPSFFSRIIQGNGQGFWK
jgi:hypothetical protein